MKRLKLMKELSDYFYFTNGVYVDGSIDNAMRNGWVILYDYKNRITKLKIGPSMVRKLNA